MLMMIMIVHQDVPNYQIKLSAHPTDGNRMKICPWGNPKEMFKPQICFYPVKIYRESFQIKWTNEITKC